MVLTPTVLPNSFGVPPDLSFPYLLQARGSPCYGFCALEMPQALLIPICLFVGSFFRPFCSSLLVQNKHSTRSVYEASEAMLIFVIMGGQWMHGFFGEPSARAVNSPPPSCYKDSIEQVAPAMPRARHEPN